MLTLNIALGEGFDDESQTFIPLDVHTIELEHSLASLSAWESKWEKPFLSSKKTEEEVLDYVRRMTLTPNIPDKVFQSFKQEHYDAINEYINSKQSATWFSEKTQKGAQNNNEIITAEIIYHWMIALEVPVEFQHWHLEKLLTLIKVCNEKNNPKKTKMSPAEAAARRHRLNAERQAKYGTPG